MLPGDAVTTSPASVMSETELDNQIRAIAKDLGLKRYHTFDSRKSPSGFPDLVLAGPGGVLFRELKRQDKKPTAAQQEWLTVLTQAGQDAGVWRPSSLLSGQVAHELTAIARAGTGPAERPHTSGDSQRLQDRYFRARDKGMDSWDAGRQAGIGMFTTRLRYERLYQARQATP